MRIRSKDPQQQPSTELTHADWFSKVAERNLPLIVMRHADIIGKSKDEISPERWHSTLANTEKLAGYLGRLQLQSLEIFSTPTMRTFLTAEKVREVLRPLLPEVDLVHSVSWIPGERGSMDLPMDKLREINQVQKLNDRRVIIVGHNYTPEHVGWPLKTVLDYSEIIARNRGFDDFSANDELTKLY